MTMQMKDFGFDVDGLVKVAIRLQRYVRLDEAVSRPGVAVISS